MSDKRNLKWWPPPSWIYYFCRFWSHDLLLVAADNITAKLHQSMSIGGRVIAIVQKSKMTAAAILDFIFVKYFGIRACRISNTHAKFRANMCNSKRVMSDRWNSKWRLPPSWIYYFCPFWSNCLFLVTVIYIDAKFHSSASIGGWVVAVCTKIQDGGRHTPERWKAELT